MRELPGPVKVVVLFVVLWVACGLVGTAALTAADASNQRLYSTLIKRGVQVDATVTRTEPQNHSTVFYTFVADGVTHSSSSVSWPPNPAASELSIGDDLYVVYDSADPSTSCACDPQKAAVPNELWRRLISGLFLGSVIAVVITSALVRWWTTRRTTPEDI
jgi:hypothetical protein